MLQNFFSKTFSYLLFILIIFAVFFSNFTNPDKFSRKFVNLKLFTDLMPDMNVSKSKEIASGLLSINDHNANNNTDLLVISYSTLHSYESPNYNESVKYKLSSHTLNFIYESYFSSTDKIFVVDLNADRLLDLIIIKPGSVYLVFQDPKFAFKEPFYATGVFDKYQGWGSPSTHLYLAGDINGDKKTDLLGFGDENVYVSFSDGKNLEPLTLALSSFYSKQTFWKNNDVFPKVLGDVNGDGFKDIVSFGIKNIWVALSNGKVFLKPTIYLNNYFTQSNGWNSFFVFPRFLMDINHDGKDDIIGFGNNNLYVSYSYGSGFTAPEVLLNNNFNKEVRIYANNYTDNEVFNFLTIQKNFYFYNKLDGAIAPSINLLGLKN